MSDLKTYEIDYGPSGGEPERFQVTHGSEPEILVKDYAETNGYAIREIASLNLKPVRTKPFSDEEAQELARDAVDQALITVQDAVGSTSGDFASMYFSDDALMKPEEAFRRMLIAYAGAEVMNARNLKMLVRPALSDAEGGAS